MVTRVNDSDAVYEAAQQGAAARFRALAETQPGAPAILTRGRTLSYGEVLRKAEGIARTLRAEGITQGHLVGVYASRSEAGVVATLGVALAGAGYVPLDPTHAPEQLAFITRDLGLRVVLVQERYAALAAADLGAECRQVKLETTISERDTETRGVIAAPLPHDPEAPAYVMYTSGTTGTPKGVVMPNRALSVYPFQRFMGFGPGDIVLHHCTLAADGSVFDIWCPLLNGAALAIVEDDTPTARAVADTMRYHAVTAVGWYAGLHHVVIDHDIEAFASVRFNLSGGDRMSAPHIARLLARWPDMAVYNSFGPTETCVGALYQRISLEMAEAGSVPIGKPYHGYDAFLMAPDGKWLPAEPGAEGEIVIAGSTVAIGYHNRTSKTAEVFIPDPRQGKAGIVYRTGDLGRITDDGAFEHRGRVDRQVKVGGRRVELDGLEAALGAEPGVVAAAVWSVERPSGRALEAAIELTPELSARGATAAASAIRSSVAAQLGHAVVPAVLRAVPKMPLTAAGKVDRARLAAEGLAGSRRADPATSSQSETRDTRGLLGEIWDALLGCGMPADDSTFFELGGNSLQLIEAHARIEAALGRPVPIAELFAAPRFADQAARLAIPGAAAAASSGSGSQEGEVARARCPAPHDQHAIAVIGMAARLPGLRETGRAALDAFWSAMRNGQSLVTVFDGTELEQMQGVSEQDMAGFVAARPVIEDPDLFDAAYFGIRPRDADKMDPQARLFLELCRHALDDAGMVGKGSATAVFAAATQSTYLLHNLLGDRSEVERFSHEHQLGDMARLTGNSVDSLATRVTYRLGLTGPAMSVGAACSGSLVAIAQAVACLRAGQADAALAGGISVSFPQRRGYVAQDGGMASLDGTCRPYDADANGTVFGDGAGVLVLKRLGDALRDGDPIRAVIRGVGLNNDGDDKMAYTAPSVAGQALAVMAAQRDAGISASEIGYVEGHGTATPLGDPIEVEALARAFDTGTAQAGTRCFLGSVKGNIGHSDAAAGVLGAIKTILALEHEEIPPVAHFSQPNPRIDFARTPFAVPDTAVPWQKRRAAGVSSFGVGGTNAHLVLTAAPADAEHRAHHIERSAPHVFPLSARSPDALKLAAQELADVCDRADAPDLSRVAATLQHGRASEPLRLAIAATTPGEAALALRAARASKMPVSGTARIVFLLPGQGAQYPGMGAGLYEAEPCYARVIDDGAEILRPLLGEDIRDVLLSRDMSPDAAARALRDTRLTQPALFLTEVALARLWDSRGIGPDVLIGHSVGEISAAVISGVMTFEEGVRLIARRGQLMQDQPEGAMLAVRTSEETLKQYMDHSVDLAARNAANMLVVSGPFDAIEALEERLEAAGLSAGRLHTSHAFHSHMMTDVAEALEQEFAGLRLQAPRIPIISTVTGTWMSKEQACQPAYWARQARARVDFAQALDTLGADAPSAFLEVGPGAVLSAFAAQTLGRNGPVRSVQSLPGHGTEADDCQVFASAIGSLWSAGAEVDWSRAGEPRDTRRVSLPGTVFERRRHWIEPPALSTGAPVSTMSVNPEPRGKVAPAAVTRARSDIAQSPDPRALEAILLDLLSDLSGEALGLEHAEAHFLELGYDSLFMGEVATSLQRRFGVTVSFRSLLSETPTARALAEHLAPRISPGAVLAEGNPEGSNDDVGPKAVAQEDMVERDRAVAAATVADGASESIALLRDQLAAMEKLVEGQARLLELVGAGQAQPPGGDAPRAATSWQGLPPTEGQREIWMVHQLGDAQAAAFNEGLSVVLEGTLDREALHGALSDLVGRHDALRMRFARSGETFEILPDARVDLAFHDLSDGPDHAYPAFLERDAAQPIPLTCGLPYRFALLRLAPEQHVVVLTIHHIACDGWSFGTLISELGALYTARTQGGVAELAAAPSFAAHALAEAERTRNEDALRWWTDRLSDAPALPELPLDHPRTGTRSFKGGTVVAEIPANVIGAARKLGARQGCTLYATLFAALQIVLGRLSGASDLVIGVPTGGQAELDDPGLVGHCVNLLPVRVPMRPDAPVSEHLRAVGSELSEAFDRRGITLGTLVRTLDLPRDLRRQPLTEVQFNLERAMSDLRFGTLRASARSNPKAFVNFDLFFDAAEHAEGVRVTVHFNAGLFETKTVTRWVEHLTHVLEAFGGEASTAISEVELLSRAEAEHLVETLNATQRAVPFDDVPARIADQARLTPRATAVEDGAGALNYTAFDAYANSVAVAIQAHCPEPGARIAVCLPRDRFLPAALVGVMRAGATYVPLDPGQPRARRAQVIEAAHADAVLGSAATAGDNNGRPLVDIARLPKGQSPVPVAPDPERPAFVIFTSGSTGRPKGVSVPMRGLANLLHTMSETPGLHAEDRLLAVTTVSFDIAALELFGPLTVGGTVRVASREDVLARGALTAELEAGAFSVMQATPTFWALLLEMGVRVPNGLKVLVGGEPLPADLAEHLTAEGAELWNLYGPTETTIWSAVKKIEPGRPVTIGGPVANTELHVLDPDGRLLPPGAVGELCIGGQGLALGYLDRPDLTEAAFRDVPLLGKTRRLYRTGDLARRLGTGEIEVLGRRDGQVKLRGYRLELGEVETNLRAAPDVAAAAANLVGSGADARLAAWVVAREGAEVNVKALSDQLSAALPDYMVPALWAQLASLPQTANGKLDRRGLPFDALGPLARFEDGVAHGAKSGDGKSAMTPPSSGPGLAAAQEASGSVTTLSGPLPQLKDPNTEAIEETIAEIWASVLGRDDLDRDATLYQLGADSLTVFRIAARQLAAGLDIEARDVLAHPSIARLARLAAGRAPSSGPQRPALSDYFGGARRRRRHAV